MADIGGSNLISLQANKKRQKYNSVFFYENN